MGRWVGACGGGVREPIAGNAAEESQGSVREGSGREHSSSVVTNKSHPCHFMLKRTMTEGVVEGLVDNGREAFCFSFG